ncbi:MAG TPA: ATP-binding protein [Ktedonobacteraceae bacterium]|nr:ATP-binding protein [Ktedonobacteraceae bacterium]
MLIAMAGLPGTGKSTLARLLANHLAGIILDKDTIRAALFPADLIEYSIRQDDFCMSVLFQVATYLLNNSPEQSVFVDGRPFSFSYQIAALDQLAAELKQPLKIIECTCSDETALQRLSKESKARSTNPATNRDYALYLAVKARFEPIREPKLLVNTDEDLAHCLEVCLAYLAG